jgi:hypothetical protein
MSIEYILVIVLGFILYYLNSIKICKKENFQASTDKCEFIPWGPSKRACMDRCRVDREMWGGDACTQSKCYDICDQCADVNKCKWLNTRDMLKNENKEPENVEVEIELNGIEADNKCILQFFHNSLVNMYILKYFESSNPNEGVKIFYIRNPKENLNTVVIDNLKNRTTYSFVLVPIANKNQLKSSNKIELTPNEMLNISSY